MSNNVIPFRHQEVIPPNKRVRMFLLVMGWTVHQLSKLGAVALIGTRMPADKDGIRRNGYQYLFLMRNLLNALLRDLDREITAILNGEQERV